MQEAVAALHSAPLVSRLVAKDQADSDQELASGETPETVWERRMVKPAAVTLTADRVKALPRSLHDAVNAGRTAKAVAKNPAVLVAHFAQAAGDDSPTADVVSAHAEATTATQVRVAEPVTSNVGSGVMRISGKELLGSVSIPGPVGGVATNLPAGGVLLMVPANPRFIDGCRIAKMLEMYDQWRIVSIVLEYHPVASAFTAGSLVMGYVNDIADPLTLETGFQAVRDLFTRAGAAMFNVNSGGRVTLGHPLLKWYYTADQMDPQFEMPGCVVVQTTQPLSADEESVTVPLGLVTMSYEIELRSPSIEGPIALNFSVDALSLGMTTATGAVGAVVMLPWAGVPTQLQRIDSVFWGTIVAVDDTAYGSAGWRTWRDSNGGRTLALSPGNILYMRTAYDGAGNMRMIFAPSLADALELNSVGVGTSWVGTAAQNATVRGFKLWNISGCDAEGSNE